MKKIIFTLLLLCVSFASEAQYTEVINSRRPGFSESPYGVGTKVLQLEGGLFYRNREVADLVSRKGFGTELFVRYGRFLEKLEVNLDVAFENQKLDYKNLSLYTGDAKTTGISRLTVGAKYLIYNQKFTDKSKEIRSWKRRTAFDKKRLIPSVGVAVGLNTNFLAEDFKRDGISLKGAILLQNDFSDRLILVTNIYGDHIGKDYKEYGYIATVTYATSPVWSVFFEHQGAFKDPENEFTIGGGVAYLFSQDIQFDASVRTNVVGNNNMLFAGLGASWRWDRHEDKPIVKGEKASKGKKKTGGFLGRIFGKKNKRPKKRKRRRRKK